MVAVKIVGNGENDTRASKRKKKKVVGHKTNNGGELSRLVIPAHTTSPPRRHYKAQ
jgi:hypothetical protein